MAVAALLEAGASTQAPAAGVASAMGPPERLRGWIRASSGFLLRHLDRTGRLPARHDGVDGAGAGERGDLRALSACMVALSHPEIGRAWADDARRADDVRGAVRRMLAVVLRNLEAEGADPPRLRPPALRTRTALVLARIDASVPGIAVPDESDDWFTACRDAFTRRPRLAFAALHAPLWLAAGRRRGNAEMVDFALILAEWVGGHQRLSSAEPATWGGIARVSREPDYTTAGSAVALVCGVEAARCNGDRIAERRLRRMAVAAFDFVDRLRVETWPGAAAGAALAGGVCRSARDRTVTPQAVAALLDLACVGLAEPAWHQG